MADQPIQIEVKGPQYIYICPKCGGMATAGPGARFMHVACGAYMKRAGLPEDVTYRATLITDETDEPEAAI